MKMKLLIPILALAAAEKCKEDFFSESDAEVMPLWRPLDKVRPASDPRFTVLPLLSKAQILRKRQIQIDKDETLIDLF